MQAVYHMDITHQALRFRFSAPALAVIRAANLGQDSLRGQIGHPEYHFDDNNFLQGLAYIRLQRQLIHKALDAGLQEQASLQEQPRQKDPARLQEQAWQAFGRLVHGAQDFYAHSNYVQLWFDRQSALSASPQPEDIEPLDMELINHPGLISGHIYLPWEALSFIPFLEPLMRRLLPADSHTRLNLDKPQRGPLFAFAFAAARKRTEREFQHIQKEILQKTGESGLRYFTGQVETTG